MKISLETLPKATEQQVFDHVARHLLSQNEKSLFPVESRQGEMCAYRNPRGLKCAAGCLISDKEYFSDMETKTWRALQANDEVPGEHSILIRQLQILHDGCPPSQWKRKLLDVAGQYGFNTDVLRGSNEYHS